MSAADERWVITGASGRLGSCIVERLGLALPPTRILAGTGHTTGRIAGIDLTPLPLEDGAGLQAALRAAHPTHIVHAAGVTTVAAAYADPGRAHRLNVAATIACAAAARAMGAVLVFVSTDMVFDGEHAPYRAPDPVAPVSVYGRTKAAAEAALGGLHSVATIARCPLLYGPTPAREGNEHAAFVERLRAGPPLSLFEDEWRTPLTYVDAAHRLIELARAAPGGVVHLAGGPRLSRLELGLQVAAAAGIEHPHITPARRADVPAPEPRPRDLSLA